MFHSRILGRRESGIRCGIVRGCQGSGDEQNKGKNVTVQLESV